NKKKRRGLKNLPVAYKMALLFAILIAMTLGTFWLNISLNLVSLLESQTKTLGNAIATQSARSATELLLADDTLSLNVIAAKLMEDDNINHAAFFNNKGELVAASPNIIETQQKLILLNKHFQTQHVNEFIEPIIFQNIIVGYAQISLNNKLLTQTFQRTLIGMSVAALVLVIISIASAFLLSRNITRPLLYLIGATETIAKGDFDARIANDREDEIGQLISSFNSMATGLKEREQIKSTFSQYMSPNIASNILANLDQPRIPGKYIHASVLFVDIAGFTAMCEQMSPQQVEHLLNDYYELILKASRLYKGTVDKYIGDGAMILFGAPEDDPQHSFHATCCAQLLASLVQRLNNERNRYNSPIIQFKLGIHSGEMLAGTIGSKEHLQYTVVGNAVNIASRLCDAAQAGELIVSADVYHQIESDKEDDCEQKLVMEAPQMLALKGKSEPIQTFVVTDVDPKYRAIIDKQAATLLQSISAVDPSA
ncbi:MAG: HAMP domain-containing protein, partial [Gammaproteobacteria bacterium]|nr:HAMP domain-containing protein [Gammaproteobacteria bacterium]